MTRDRWNRAWKRQCCLWWWCFDADERMVMDGELSKNKVNQTSNKRNLIHTSQRLPRTPQRAHDSPNKPQRREHHPRRAKHLLTARIVVLSSELANNSGPNVKPQLFHYHQAHTGQEGIHWRSQNPSEAFFLLPRSWNLRWDDVNLCHVLEMKLLTYLYMSFIQIHQRKCTGYFFLSLFSCLSLSFAGAASKYRWHSCHVRKCCIWAE